MKLIRKQQQQKSRRNNNNNLRIHNIKSSRTVVGKQQQRKKPLSCRFSKLILMITIFIGFILYFVLLYSTLSKWAATAAADKTKTTSTTSSDITPTFRNNNNNSSSSSSSRVTAISISKYNNNNNVTPMKQQQQQQQQQRPPKIIGIASTITNCGSDDRFIEGAAVLKYSIDMTSASSSSSNNNGNNGNNSNSNGKYDYKFYIMYHPDAISCVEPLRELGFVLLERPTPVNVSDIQGLILKERIINNGCCGERELIKLEAYRLIQHEIVIHLDLDVLVLKPMDPIIDLMITHQHPSSSSEESSKLLPTIMWPDQQQIPPNDIQLLFTKDYNVVAPKRKDKPFQGGFFVIKPSLETYNDMIEIVLTGDYRDDGPKKGWGGIVGPFYGGMTVQGLLPWYYEYLHPGKAVELNRCTYNNIADNPTTEKSINDEAVGKCRTNEEKCEDCRKRNITEIVVFHFPICLKPWTCVPQKRDIVSMRLCRKAHHEWFKYRSALEMSWGRVGTGTGSYERDHFLGYCNSTWSKGYIPIEQPYGKPVI